MIWIKTERGVYHLLKGELFICGVRIDLDDHYQVDTSNDPPGNKRCKNCIRSIDHIHYSVHIHDGNSIDDVAYRYGKWPMIFTRKLVVCSDFGKIEKTFTNVWIQQTGEVEERYLRDAIAVYSIHKKGYIDTTNVEIIDLRKGWYYRFG